jgi:FAD/FMN-containing dehydrogenase
MARITDGKSSCLGRRALLQGAAAGGAAFALPGCHYVMDPGGWMNALGTTYTLPRWHWTPGSAADLVSAVQRAEREGRRIRMTGSGHSFSDVAVSEDWLLSPRGLTQILPVDATGLRSGANPETLVRVQSGRTIFDLNRGIVADRGLALQNMGGAEVQTYVGAATTGTHGSGLAFGPLASQIVAIQVVSVGGQILQIEPTDGISDPATFSGRLAEDPSARLSLVQDDAMFNAMAVSIGCLGVIYAVVLRAVPKYWLIERRTLTTWEFLAKADGVVDRLMRGATIAPAVPDLSPLPSHVCIPPAVTEPDHVEIYYTPYPGETNEHVALLTQRWRVDCEPPGVGASRGSALFTPGEHLTALADRYNLLVPFFPQHTENVRKFHVTALTDMQQSYYANVSHLVYNIGVLNDVHAYGVELAFDLQQAHDAVTLNFRLAQQLADGGMHHSAPVSLRFVKASPAYLAMQNGRKTMMMEIGVLAGLYGAEELLRYYEEAFVNAMKARPHWGLDRNYLRSEAAVASLFPAWSSWKQAFAQLNPSGTFDGSVTDRLGISRR